MNGFCLEEKAAEETIAVTVVCPNCCNSCSITMGSEDTAKPEKKFGKRPTERISAAKKVHVLRFLPNFRPMVPFLSRKRDASPKIPVKSCSLFVY